MFYFDSHKDFNWFISSKTLERKLVETEKYLAIQPTFIEFQDWSSQKNNVVLDDSTTCRDIPSTHSFRRDELFNDEELEELFIMAEMLDNQVLCDELAKLEEYLAESKTVLIACPENMPSWENAWWGEKVLRELG